MRIFINLFVLFLSCINLLTQDFPINASATVVTGPLFGMKLEGENKFQLPSICGTV